MEPPAPSHYNQEAGGGGRPTEGQEDLGRGSAPRPFHSLPWSPPLTAQQLHAKGDAVVPRYGQDAHKASQEGRLKHVLLVGIIVQVAGEDLEAEGVSGGPQKPVPLPSEPLASLAGHPWSGAGKAANTYPAVCGPLVLVLSPVRAVVAVGHLVGCHILDVAKVSGPLRDDAGHLLQGAQVNLWGTKSTAFSLLGRPP